MTRFFYMLFKNPLKKINILKVGFNLTELHLTSHRKKLGHYVM